MTNLHDFFYYYYLQTHTLSKRRDIFTKDKFFNDMMKCINLVKIFTNNKNSYM